MATDGGRKEAGRGTVLIADDSRLVRASVGAHLRRAGFHVEEAGDGEDALGLLCEYPFDVLITDLHMPRRDGFALMEAAKTLDEPPEMIVLTGTLAEDMRAAVRALRLGAHDFLTKPPASADEVVTTVSRAVEKKRLRDTSRRLMSELEHLSRTDPLTGVENRRSFDEALRTEQARAARYGLPLSLILLDVDHFKSVNDLHGHPVGDGVLQRFAGVVSSLLREGDGLYRYGGEEFVLLLPHTDVAGAHEVAERIVATVAQASLRVGGLSLRITCSAGVAATRRDGAGPNDLVERADVALYAAKAGGRNQALADATTPTAAPAGGRVIRFARAG